MDYRGARMQGPPPHSSFRPRGGRGNNSINHHPVPNQHHHPSQIQPRIFNPAMNQAQWNTQSPMNTHNAQQEGLNYPQPPYTPDTAYNNYTFHQTLSSPELIGSNPQPQSFPTFPQQMFIQPQVFMDPAVCYQSPPMVTTPPMAPPIDTPVRKFHFNSKDNVVHCSNCGHKNILAETEIIKRDERIDNLDKENQVFRKQTETIMAENTALRLKLEAFQSQKSKGKEFGGSTELQQSVVKVEEPDGSLKSEIDNESVSDDAKKQKPLSPDAAEFSPKSSTEALSVVAMSAPATAEVPVVSAKGVMDEEGDAYPPVQASEAGTQVEENLFEETSLEETLEDLAAPDPEPGTYSAEFPIKDSTTQVQHANWSDEVDKTTAQEDSFGESKTEQVTAEVAPVAEETWDGGAPVTSSAPEQNWRESNSQINIPSDHWQQKNFRDRRHNNRGNKFRGQAPGFGRGRGRSNDQEQYNDNFRPNYPHNRPDHRGYGNQNVPRFQRSNEENWDNRPKDQRDGQRYDARNNRNQRFSEKSDRYEDDHHKQNDEQENRSREWENRPTEKSCAPKYEEKNNYTRDHKDNSRKNSWSKDRSNRDNSDLRDMKETGPQVQGAWRGKDNSLSFNKDEKKESQLIRESPNQNQGNYSNRSNRQNAARAIIPDIVKEISGDLFSSPGDFSLAHCVAQDFRMGSGIAVRFKNDFKRVGELLDQNVQVGGCAHLQDHDRFIFYLVTKEVSNGKPRLEDLRESLRAMKAKCLNFGVKKLAMPRIGCGLDRLDWSRVKYSINEIFQDTNIEIKVYDWNVSPNYYKWNKKSRCYNDYSENTSRHIHDRYLATRGYGNAFNLRRLFLMPVNSDSASESDSESEMNEVIQNVRFSNKPKNYSEWHERKPENYKVTQNLDTYNKHKTLCESKSERNEVNKHEDSSYKSKKNKKKHDSSSKSDVTNQYKEYLGKPKKQSKTYEAESVIDEDIQNIKCSGKSKKQKKRYKPSSESDDEDKLNKEHSKKSKRQKKRCESKSRNEDDGVIDEDDRIVELPEKPKKHKKVKEKRKKVEKSSISEFGEKKSIPMDDKNAQMNDSTDKSFEIPHDKAGIKIHSHRNVSRHKWEVTETEVSDKESFQSTRHVKDKTDD